MRINWIEFENLRTGLKIERVNFYNDITLLVGLSGVGKSQILNSIEYSLRLAVRNDIDLEPYDVKISLEMFEKEYIWEYRIEPIKNEVVLENKVKKYNFVYEKLSENNRVIMSRNEEGVQVSGYDKVPTPKKDESLLVQYSEDELINSIIKEMKKLNSIEMEMDVRGAITREGFNKFKTDISEIMNRNPKTPFVKFSQLPVSLKLYITKKYYPEMYTRIFDSIKELFMEINDIDILEDSIRDCYVVAINVYDKILMQHEISNGMLKTIYYIVELITMPKDSLVLIDEFENGLGVNCIDVLAELLFNERTDLQFVITSHHPTIINQISSKKWRIIDREINVVKNVSAEEYGLTHSQHDAYFNLINRWEFERKI